MRMTILTTALLLVGSFAFAAQEAAQTRGVTVRDSRGSEIELYVKSHALLIGVSDYTAGWDDLDSIPDELDSVEQVLIEQGFEVDRVYDPDSDQLEQAFEDFLDDHGYDPANRLLIYYSGHGYTRKTKQGLRGYLVPADAPDPRVEERSFLRKALAMSNIENWARLMEARHVLFVFDSCFSGTIFKTRGLPDIPPHISARTAKKVRQFITAGGADEVVPAASVFTPSFVRALRGEGDTNRDGYVTGVELGVFLHDRIVGYQTGQTPQFGKIKDPNLDEGDFVFTLTATATATAPTLAPLTAVALVKDPNIRRPGGLDLSDLLDKKNRANRDWVAYQKQMQVDYATVMQLDEAASLEPEDKLVAWRRFSSTYGEDNALSQEDDELRDAARLREEYWRGAETRRSRGLARQVLASVNQGFRSPRATPVDAYRYEATFVSAAASRQVHGVRMYPDRVKLVMPSDTGEEVIVIDGDRGFLTGVQGSRELTAEEIDDTLNPDPWRPTRPITENLVNARMTEFRSEVNPDWYPDASLVGEEVVEGIPCKRVDLNVDGAETMSICVAADGAILQTVWDQPYPETGALARREMTASDIRQVQGRPAPHRLSLRIDGANAWVATTTALEFNPSIDDSLFALPRVIPMLTIETYNPTSAALSPDGSRIAGTGWDNRAKVWDTATGKPIASISLENYGDLALDVAFSPDGSRIVTGGRDARKLGVWDANTGAHLLDLNLKHRRKLFCDDVSFTTDGTMVAAQCFAQYGNDGRILRVWNASTGALTYASKEKERDELVQDHMIEGLGWTGSASGWTEMSHWLRTAEGLRGATAFSPDDSMIVTSMIYSGGMLYKLDPRTGKLLQEAKVSVGDVYFYDVEFSQDGSRIATAACHLEGSAYGGNQENGGKGYLTVWDAETLTELESIASDALCTPTANESRAVAYGPDGTPIIIGDNSQTIEVWKVLPGPNARTPD